MSTPLERDLAEILSHSADLWEPLRGRSIFVTGGTGFVGTWMMELMAWADAKLDLRDHAVLLTRDPDAFRKKSPQVAERVELLKGDCEERDLPTGEFAYVIHAATETQRPLEHHQPATAFEKDLRVTKRILEFARSSGAKRFLFTSSGAVYGTQPNDLNAIPEDYLGAPSPMDGATSYGQAKRASEFLCAMYARQCGFDALIARLFAFVGPHLPLEGYAVGNFMRDVLREKMIRIESDGTTVRSYLYASDMALWLWTILLRGESLRPYNVGSPEALSVRELAERVASVGQRRAGVEVLGRRGVPATRYVPSTERAEKELGLSRRVSLDEGLKRSLEWHRAN